MFSVTDDCGAPVDLDLYCQLFWKCLCVPGFLASFLFNSWISIVVLFLCRDADATRIDIYTGKSLMLLPGMSAIKPVVNLDLGCKCMLSLIE